MARLPIDSFFRSLGEDQKERAICIILSGMGTDGTLGLRTIKGESGMAMVQDLQSAKYAGMPSSAAATGLADYVLPPAQMPAAADRLRPGAVPQGSRAGTEDRPPAGASRWRRSFLLLRNRTGHDFSSYKGTTIRRRVERRMNVHQIEKPSDYARYLQENVHEIDVLFQELLISVTGFFRDPAAFEALAAHLPLHSPCERRRRPCASGYRAAARARRPTRSPSCCASAWRASRAGREVQIFATDIDSAAIDRARIGRLSGRHRRRRLAPASRSALRARGRFLPDPQGHPRDGDLRPAERHQGSAVHQARSDLVPQPAHLLGQRAAEEADAALSLRPPAERHPLPRHFGDRRQFPRSLHHTGRQVEDLSAQGNARRVVRAPRVSGAPAEDRGRRPGRAGGRAPLDGVDDGGHGREAASVALRAGQRHRQRSRRHRLHSRPPRCLPGTRLRPAASQHPRDGARGPADRAGRRHARGRRLPHRGVARSGARRKRRLAHTRQRRGREAHRARIAARSAPGLVPPDTGAAAGGREERGRERGARRAASPSWNGRCDRRRSRCARRSRSWRRRPRSSSHRTRSSSP